METAVQMNGLPGSPEVFDEFIWWLHRRLAVALEEGDQVVARAEEENQNLRSLLRERECSASDQDLALKNLDEERDKLQVWLSDGYCSELPAWYDLKKESRRRARSTQYDDDDDADDADDSNNDDDDDDDDDDNVCNDVTMMTMRTTFVMIWLDNNDMYDADDADDDGDMYDDMTMIMTI